ncbi:hypothetical protein GCM10008027_04750 [Pseudoalteromonas gelatinilytica]|uniref:EAL domain-containing protein n=1 Tax=Pseudoalteromonas gelatinilytica TaxID=1703256 RepID=A0ABQ1T5B3_9GAMM|nr:hypothetical protein GCM10008027_04750 [Pseudoalteromonas profundi]
MLLSDRHHVITQATENMLTSDLADVKDKMYALQRCGVMFSIDDFGKVIHH